MSQRKWIHLLLAFFSVAGFYYFISNTGKQFSGDWTDYFGPLSLFSRSAVWHYSTFPIHFPWRCGGSDLMANPQTRLFSPFLLLDVFLVPQWAMLATLMILGYLGSLGTFKLLESLEVKPRAAAVGAVLFTNSSWLALHFTEGHLTYAEMQLLPMVLLFAKTIDSKKSLFALLSLSGLMVLNGAIQALIYSGMLTVCAFIIYPNLMSKIRKFDFRYASKLMGILLLVTSPKIIPVWLTLSKRQPTLDSTVMSFKLLFTSLYYPWQEFRMAVTQGTPYVFHEYGCYLGWISSGLILAKSFQSSWRRDNRAFILLFLFWLWTGSGWGTPINPWLILQKIPIVNQAHLQSRLFILMFVFFVLLTARALSQIKKPSFFILLSSLMILESSFVRLHITRFLASPFQDLAPSTNVLIRNDNLDITVHYGIPISHYLKKNLSATECNERAFFPSQVKHQKEPDYRGEIYFTKGRGDVSLLSYTPGKIAARYSTTVNPEITINTNHLWGWKSLTPNVEVISRSFGETLKVRTPSGSGTLELKYHPKYLLPCLILFAIGLILFVREFICLRKTC